MTGDTIALLQEDEQGSLSLSYNVNYISREGKHRYKEVANFVAAHTSMSGVTNQLKAGLDRTDSKKVQSDVIKGEFKEVIGELHMALAKIRCSCDGEEYLKFDKATVDIVKSGFFSNTFGSSVTYRCPNCDKSYTAEGLF